MSDDLPGLTLPCGCRRGVTKRMAPDIDESGHPVLDGNGAFVMKEIEELQETYCGEHTKVLVERQYEAQRALDSGAAPDDVVSILMGGSPFKLLDE